MLLFAGLDLGTTHTKIVVLDTQGRLLHQAKSSYKNGNTTALDPLEIQDLALQLIAEAVSVIPDYDASWYISISAAMHSLMLVDAVGHPLTSLSTWADTSSLELVNLYKNDPSIRNLVAETGTPFHPMTPFARLWQMRIGQPDLLNSAFKCVGIKEFIWHQLTGYWETDPSIATATGMYSPIALRWHPEAILRTGLRMDQLPEIRPVEWMRESRLPLSSSPNIHFVLGGSDGCLAQIGSRAMHPGTASLTIGTSGAMRVVQPHFNAEPDNGLFSYKLDEHHYICGGPTNNGGIVLQWWEEKIMGRTAPLGVLLNDFEKEAASVSAGCEGLVCLPYFGGERAPVWDAGASGMFSGIRMHHHQAHFKRAMVEGVCFIFRQLLERIEKNHGPVSRIIASGGFTQSKWWVQVMSDILQRPVDLGEEGADASALGAIAVAMKAAGILKNWTDFETIFPFACRTIKPVNELADLYQHQYLQFLRLCRF